MKYPVILKKIALFSVYVFCFIQCSCAKITSDPDLPNTTESGTLLAPVFDFSYQTLVRQYTWESLRNQIKTLKDMGFHRLYVIVDLPGYPSVASGVPSIGDFKTKNILSLGDDLNAAIAKVCREQGIETIAIFKPYESGGMISVPKDATVRESGYKEQSATGTYLFFDEFVGKHPEMRVLRKNDDHADDYKLPITKIELEFMLDQYTNSSRNGPVVVPEIPDASIRKPKINLWVSRNNGDYTLYPGEFSYEYKTEQRTIYDANGLVIGENKRCNVLTISGINIGEEYPYAAVTLEDSRNMRLIPYSMIRWYSGEKELKLTAATYVRILNNERHYPNQWTNQALPNEAAVSQFHEAGFAFNWYGVGFWGPGWKSTTLLGLARGKRQYMGGILCEGYPEVRQYWLDFVKHLLDIGFNGVDIRLQEHSSMCIDYMNYGYNEPIVARYKELYGVDPTSIPMTDEAYLRLMKIRGDYFMLFVEDAARLIKERKSLLFVHLRDAHENPTCNSDWNQLCFLSMPKIAIDWRRCVELADEITIKEYYWKNYKPASAKNTKDYAASLGKKVWIHCYYHQGDDFDEAYIRDIENDKRVKGILLYEVEYNFMNDLPALLEKLKYNVEQ